MEAKLKHLEFIQAVIARLSNCSFAFKGWAVTITGALLAFALSKDTTPLMIVAIYSTALFWGLDGYYLWLERGFVQLHTRVSALPEDQIDFSMSIDKDRAFVRWLRTCARTPLLMFYGVVIIVDIVTIFVIRKD